MKVPNVRQVEQGPGDPLSKAFELAVTPAIFGFLGFLLDTWLGTVPLFTALLSVFTLSYLVWKLYADYQVQMERHDQDKPWSRDARRREGLHG